MQCLYFEATKLHDARENTEAFKPVFLEKQIRQLVTVPGQLTSSTSEAKFTDSDIGRHLGTAGITRTRGQF